jgi:iron complex transport system substrate-binding protein
MMTDERASTAGPSLVSLIASATEIICALGLRDRLVGVSHECDYPEDVRRLPVCSEPRLDPAAPGGRIDRTVRELVREGTSIYHVRTEILEGLRPDLIVTQDQCHVCAVSLADVERACSALTHKAVRICTLTPHTFADIFADFERVGVAAGVPKRGRALAMLVRDRLAALEARTKSFARPKVACIEWLDPPMVAGGWMPDLIRMAGGEPVLVTSGERFRTVSWDEIAAANPEVVVLLPCGFSVGRTLEELGEGRTASALRRLRATEGGRTFVADGNAFFNRPGPRIADSGELLAALLHPDRFGPPAAGDAVPWT